MRIPAFDPRAQDGPLLEEIKDAIGGVLDSGRYIGGPSLEEFESDLASFVGCSDAVGVSSGTDALLAVLMALGVGPGKTVITTPFTFFATAGVVVRLGAGVRFCDVDDDLNLDQESLCGALEQARTCGEDVVAVLPVHLFGKALDLDGMISAAADHGAVVVEDAAQAIGARHGDRRVGALARAACFSFYPTKNLGAFGDAGAVTCDDPEFAALLRQIRNHGMDQTYSHPRVGGNFRLDAIQAAALRIKLRHVEGWNRQRCQIASHYLAGFDDRGLTEVKAPEEGAEGQHVFHQFVVRVPQRDALKQALADQGIGSTIYYPMPLHQQPCLERWAPEGGCPRAEKAAQEVLALPLWPGLGEDQVEEVLDAVQAFFRQ